jgi:dihydrofolate reductase
VFQTQAWQRMSGAGPGETGIDNDFMVAGDVNIGAHVMGRNMFGPIRGEWGDDQWRGWWGDNPPYHHPVFVLTHHQHDSIEMEGGTTFHFVTDGPEAALEQAVTAADGQDVRIGGGASTIAQYLRLGLLDELHLAYVPILLGRGESPIAGIDLTLNYRIAERVISDAVTHIRIVKR